MDDTLTRLMLFFAKKLIDVNAELIALKNAQKASLLCVAEADPKIIDDQMAGAVAAARVLAAKRLLEEFEAEPELAWLGAQLSSKAVQ